MNITVEYDYDMKLCNIRCTYDACNDMLFVLKYIKNKIYISCKYLNNTDFIEVYNLYVYWYDRDEIIIDILNKIFKHYNNSDNNFYANVRQIIISSLGVMYTAYR